MKIPDSATFWPEAEANPGVDPKLLAHVAELRREVEKFGPGEQSSYRLAPALGGTVIRQTAGNATPGSRSPFSSVLARAN